jgi:predicted dehydrogenase
MPEKLKIGVIGLGMGAAHIKGYMKHPNAEIVAIAARPDPRTAALGENFPTFKGKLYSDGMEMLEKEKLDIVSVAVPNFLHKDLTIAALESGANVLCEKPMAMNAADAQQMADTAKKVGKKLGINFSYRFRAPSRAMKALVDEGIFGDIYYGRSFWFRRRGIPGLATGGPSQAGMGPWFFDKNLSGGGPLIDLGVHRLDLALWLMGYPKPTWVMGSTYDRLARKIAEEKGIRYTVEDMACAMIKFDNGATLELGASWAANIKENELQNTRLLGDKGGLFQYNLQEGYTFDLEYYYEIAGRQFDSRMHTFPEVPSAYWLFVEAVRTGTPFMVDPEEGVTVMKILDAVYKSAAEGAPVKID